jgi:hypothetical protein
MPKSIRSDNGQPFGVPNRDSISLVNIWLQGWGVSTILNPPRQPQKNGKVERGHGTSSRWAEVYNCKNVVEMQERLEEVIKLQRENYPVRRLDNRTRVEAYPELNDSPRPFKDAKFDPDKSFQHLAKLRMSRKVCSSGYVYIYSMHCSVDKKYKGSVVSIQFNPTTKMWEISDNANIIIKTVQDPRFTPENIENLLCQRTSKSRTKLR